MTSRHLAALHCTSNWMSSAGSSANSSRSSLASDRPDLSARLQGFFSSATPAQPDAPAYAAGPQPSSSSHPDMRLPRTQPSSASVHHPPKQSSSLRHSHSLSIDSLNMTSPPAESSARDKKHASRPTLPVLRWFSSKRSDGRPNSTPSSPVDSRPQTPTRSAPSTPSSALSALADAFQDDPHLLEAHSREHSEDVKLPSRPQAARLSTALHRPSYFSNLTRSTMPTAFLSPPPAASYMPPRYSDPFEEACSQHNYNDADMDLSTLR